MTMSIVLDPISPRMHILGPESAVVIKLDDDQGAMWIEIDGVTRLFIDKIGEADIDLIGFEKIIGGP